VFWASICTISRTLLFGRRPTPPVACIISNSQFTVIIRPLAYLNVASFMQSLCINLYLSLFCCLFEALRTSITSYVYYAACFANRLLRDVGRYFILLCPVDAHDVCRAMPLIMSVDVTLLISVSARLSVGRCRPCCRVHEVFRAVSPAWPVYSPSVRWPAD
jgi:hypothetical protein